MAQQRAAALQAAITAVDAALARLEAASDLVQHERAQSIISREASQAELTRSWQEHNAGLEAQLSEISSENEFLKQDNLRLANQLQRLQKDYLELQKMTGDAVHRLDSSVRQLDLILEH